jgi:hypothetical protein
VYSTSNAWHLQIVYLFISSVLSLTCIDFMKCRGVGYPDLWPSVDCREPLDVSKNFTFEVIASMLAGKFSFS